MITPHVTIYIAKPDTVAFFEAMKPVWDAINKEPKCLSIEIFQSSDPAAEDVEIFRVTEVWDSDQEWYTTVQAKKEYFKPYFAVLERLSVKPMEFAFWTRMDRWCFVKQDWLDTIARG